MKAVKSALVLRMTYTVLRLAGTFIALLVLFLKSVPPWWSLVAAGALAIAVTRYLYRDRLRKPPQTITE